MLADTLTKVIKSSQVYMKFRSKQLFSLARDKSEQDEDQRRVGLRQGPRQRRKARDKARLQSPTADGDQQASVDDVPSEPRPKMFTVR